MYYKNYQNYKNYKNYKNYENYEIMNFHCGNNETLNCIHTCCANNKLPKQKVLNKKVLSVDQM